MAPFRTIVLLLTAALAGSLSSTKEVREAVSSASVDVTETAFLVTPSLGPSLLESSVSCAVLAPVFRQSARPQAATLLVPDGSKTQVPAPPPFRPSLWSLVAPVPAPASWSLDQEVHLPLSRSIRQHGALLILAAGTHGSTALTAAILLLRGLSLLLSFGFWLAGLVFGLGHLLAFPAIAVVNAFARVLDSADGEAWIPDVGPFPRATAPRYRHPRRLFFNRYTHRGWYEDVAASSPRSDEFFLRLYARPTPAHRTPRQFRRAQEAAATNRLQHALNGNIALAPARRRSRRHRQTRTSRVRKNLSDYISGFSAPVPQPWSRPRGARPSPPSHGLGAFRSVTVIPRRPTFRRTQVAPILRVPILAGTVQGYLAQAVVADDRLTRQNARNATWELLISSSHRDRLIGVAAVTLAKEDNGLRPRPRNFDRATAMGKTDPGPAISTVSREKYTMQVTSAAPILESLGGAMRVPTEYLVSAAPPDFASFAPGIDESIPRTITDTAAPVTLLHGDAFVGLTRPSRFRRHFPETARLIAQPFEDSPPLYVAQRAGRAIPVNAGVRHFGLHPVPPTSINPQYEMLGMLASGDYSESTRRSVESILSRSRLAGVRGNRNVILNWEALAQDRFEAQHGLFTAASAGQRYYRAMYVLWSRYFQARLHAHLQDQGYRAPVQAAHPPAFPQRDLIYMGTHFRHTEGNDNRIVANGDPESPIFDTTGEAFYQLTNGGAVLIDAESMPDDVLREIVNAFVPQTRAHLWNQRGPGAGNVNRYASPLASENIHGAQTVYIHWGNRQNIVPHWDLRGDAAMPGAPAGPQHPIFHDLNFRAIQPSCRVIMRAILHMINAHHCGSDAREAFDAVLYRSVGFRVHGTPVARPAAPNGIVLSAGSNALYLPHDYTLQAYYDPFYSRLNPDPIFASIFSLTSRQFMWTIWYPNLFNGLAINWPSHAFGLYGREWRARTGHNIGGQHRDRHVYELTHTVAEDQLSQWKALHRTAAHMQYRCAPSELTALTQEQWVSDDLFADNMPCYFHHLYTEMWALDSIPAHAMFPLPYTIPLWPQDQPKPEGGIMDQQDFVRLGRDLEHFKGFNWARDGGMQYSGQHYLSVGDGRASFRHMAGAVVPEYQWEVWVTPFQRERPAAPNPFAPTWVGPIGSPFADFAVPGSVSSYNASRNRVNAIGVGITAATPEPLRQQVNEAWFRLTEEDPLQGVCVTYVMPSGKRRDFDYANEYSILSLHDRQDGEFAGLGIVSATDLSNYRSAQTAAIALLGARPAGTLAYPGYLANDNSPHVPRTRVRALPANPARHGILSTRPRRPLDEDLNRTPTPRLPTPPPPSAPPQAPPPGPGPDYWGPQWHQPPPHLLPQPPVPDHASQPQYLSAPANGPHVAYQGHNPYHVDQLPRMQPAYAHLDGRGVQVQFQPQPEIPPVFGDALPGTRERQARAQQAFLSDHQARQAQAPLPLPRPQVLPPRPQPPPPRQSQRIPDHIENDDGSYRFAGPLRAPVARQLGILDDAERLQVDVHAGGSTYPAGSRLPGSDPSRYGGYDADGTDIPRGVRSVRAAYPQQSNAQRIYRQHDPTAPQPPAPTFIPEEVARAPQSQQDMLFPPPPVQPMVNPADLGYQPRRTRGDQGSRRPPSPAPVQQPLYTANSYRPSAFGTAPAIGHVGAAVHVNRPPHFDVDDPPIPNDSAAIETQNGFLNLHAPVNLDPTDSPSHQLDRLIRRPGN